MSATSVSNLQAAQNGMVAYILQAQGIVSQTKAQVHALGGGVGEPATQAAFQALSDHLAADLLALQQVIATQANMAALAEAAAD